MISGPDWDGKPNTKAMWVYDFRTNKNFTLKKNPLRPADLDDFVSCYSAGRFESARNPSASSASPWTTC